MKRVAAVLITLAMMGAQGALAAGSHGRNYDSMRAGLLKSGYQIVKVRRMATDHYCSEGFCEIYPETLYCSMAGLHYCNMAFYRSSDRKYLVVTTLGEVEHKLTVEKTGKPDDEDMRYIRGRPDGF